MEWADVSEYESSHFYYELTFWNDESSWKIGEIDESSILKIIY